MKKRIISCVCIFMIAVICLVGTSFAASSEQKYIITTQEELEEKIAEIENDKIISEGEKKSILKDVDPKVYAEYVDEKMTKAIKSMEIASNEYYKQEKEGVYTYEKNLGDGCSVVITLEDKEENNTLDKLTSLFIDSVNAASNGEVLWKSYGNRYYTAKSKIKFAIGFAEVSLENHYYVSANGIKIRYGVSDSISAGLGGIITENEPVITDQYAKTPGKSDVNMYCKYKLNINHSGIQSSMNYFLYTRAEYEALDKVNKKIKVKHSWYVK